MDDLKNKPESEMGVPLGGSFGRLISPFEAHELVRRDQAKKKRAAQDAAANERRERREMRHKWFREEAEFERTFPNTAPPRASLAQNIGCVIACLIVFLIVAGFFNFLSSLGV